LRPKGTKLEHVEKSQAGLIATAVSLIIVWWCTQPYCWVKSKPYLLSVIFRMLMYYALMWPVFLYSLYVYGSIILHIRRVVGKTTGDDAEGAKRIRSTIGRLACFPVILMISILFASTNRVYQFIYQRDPPYWVYETHVSLLMLVSPSLRSALPCNSGLSEAKLSQDLCFVG
jgi:hypothetical protein